MVSREDRTTPRPELSLPELRVLALSDLASAHQALAEMKCVVHPDRWDDYQAGAYLKLVNSLYFLGVPEVDVTTLLKPGEKFQPRIEGFLSRLERFIERAERGLEPRMPRPPLDDLCVFEPKYISEHKSSSPQTSPNTLIQAPSCNGLSKLAAHHNGGEVAWVKFNEFQSGVRISGLMIEPEYLGRGVAGILLRKLADFQRRKTPNGSTAIIAASVNLDRTSIPLLISMKQLDFRAVGFDRGSNEVDMRLVVQGNDQLGLTALQMAEVEVVKPIDIIELLDEGEQLGFIMPVSQSERSGGGGWNLREVKAVRCQSPLGTAGFMIVRSTQSGDLTEGAYLHEPVGDIVQVGFHPLL